jgi:glycosyltransferase involved in cell wall biosynthesis
MGLDNPILEQDPMLGTRLEIKQGLIVACIPAFNEDLTLPSIIMKTQKYVDKVLVYDDGSEDMTGEMASSLNAYVIASEKNQGKGVAIRRLFEQALEFNPSVTITIDSDGQHDPNEIPKFIAPILKGEADVVLGSRYIDGAWTDAPLYRRMGLTIVNLISNGSGNIRIRDTQNGYRAYSRRALEAMLQCEAKGYGIETEQLEVAKQHNLRIKEVPVKVRYEGLAKTSKKHPLAHGIELINALLTLLVQKRPLWLLGLPGSLLLLIGLFLGGYVLWGFNETRYFSIPFALAAFGTFIIGTFLAMTSLILYGLSTMSNHHQKENKTTDQP